MAALVYRVSCASRGDQWFSRIERAEAAAREILLRAEVVTIYPLPVPQSALAFVEFMGAYVDGRPLVRGGPVSGDLQILGEESLARIKATVFGLGAEAHNPPCSQDDPASPMSEAETGDRSDRDRMFRALQWLLDDLRTANETHAENGHIFDSVQDAAAALVEAGGHLAWYSPADVAAYRAREGAA